MLQLERLRAEVSVIAAALIAQGTDAATLVEDATAKFNESLEDEPTPETPAMSLARELGVVVS